MDFYTNKNLFLKDADGVEVALQLCAVTENDQKIILNDLDTVDLEVHAVSEQLRSKAIN